MLQALAIVLTLTGSLCLYLSLPNQRWLRRSVSAPSATGSVLSSLILLTAGWAWMQALSPAAGVFTWLMMVMLLLVLFPYFSLLLPAEDPEDGHP